MDGVQILKDCERYFFESSPNSIETVILLEDAVVAVNQAIFEMDKEAINPPLPEEDFLEYTDLIQKMGLDYKMGKIEKSHYINMVKLCIKKMK